MLIAGFWTEHRRAQSNVRAVSIQNCLQKGGARSTPPLWAVFVISDVLGGCDAQTRRYSKVIEWKTLAETTPWGTTPLSVTVTFLTRATCQ